MTSTEAAASSANDVSRSCLRAIGSAASSSARHRSGYSVTNRLGTTIRVPLPYEHQEPFELFVVARPLPEIDEAGDDLDVSSNILSRAVDAVARRVEGAVPVLGSCGRGTRLTSAYRLSLAPGRRLSAQRSCRASLGHRPKSLAASSAAR